MTPADELRVIAAQQHRLVARRQAYERHITPSALQHALTSGAWERVTKRVIGLIGAPTSDLEPAMLAVLHHGPEAYVSGASALALWSIPGFSLEPVHVLSRRPISRRNTDIGIVHTTTDLLDTHITESRGVPVVTPVRAIFDIAGALHPGRVERALDNAWNRRLLDGSLLARTVRELADRGRPGTVLMRALSEARPLSFRPPGSRNESRVNDLLTRRFQRPLRKQVDAGNQAAWVGRFDLVDDEVALIVEIHSEAFHGSKLDVARDAAKRAAMETSGWTYLEVWEDDIWQRGDWVVDQIIEARRRAQPCVNLVTSRAS
jgi:very-short-patch-repair endonuclease